MVNSLVHRRFYNEAFRRELWVGAISQIEASRDASSVSLDLAWNGRDYASVVVAGRAALGQGSLTPKALDRFRTALARVGLFEEWLQSLAVAGETPDALQHAIALASEGDLAGADACLETQSSDGALALRRLLHFRGEGPLSDADALISIAMELHLPALAIRPLAANARAGLQDDEAIACLRCAQTLLRGLDEKGAVAVMAAIAPLCQGEEERSALRRAVAATQGGASSLELFEAPPGNDRRYHLKLALAMAPMAARRWPAAIQALGEISVRNRASGEFRADLARSVGRDFLARRPMRLGAPGKTPRIFDVFPFNGEFTMLEIKLRQTASWIDRFVIVEAAQTFTGLQKPLYFQEAQGRFAEFADKIVHVVVDRFPSHLDTAWAREYYQRDHGVLGLVGAMADDWVIITDVDELVREEIFEGLNADWATCAVRTYSYFLNYLRVGEHRQERKISLIRAKFLGDMGLSYGRHIAAYGKNIIDDAGWHFQSMLDPEHLRKKFESYSHEEWSGQSQADFEARLQHIRDGQDVPRFKRIPLDRSFPAYIYDNQDRLTDLILPTRSALESAAALTAAEAGDRLR